MDAQELELLLIDPLRVQNGGLFMSRGNAFHPTRTIDSHELIFVKQGTLDMWEENQNFHLEAGDTLILWPGRRHGGLTEMQPDLRFFWMHFEVTHSLENTTKKNHTSILKIPQFKRVNRPDKLEILFRMFLEDQETGELQPFTANTLMMLILTEVGLMPKVRPTLNDDSNVIATAAHTYIRINFDSTLTASSVAEAIGYNVDYLGRIYKQEYGLTLTQAIHRRRMKKACEWLLDTNLSVGQVAKKCGFNDPDYFRRIFRRHTQMTPGVYRQTYTRLHVNTH
ncbi:AraC family transcriptional regulator [Phototrophicus methaneseepsis]|uniref:AraC family transcriptional regulator n=1 Tax=Phototrophicus methaneseepsis TaxID=2710758 RepID=A0A7S8EDK5_9CHLR|nr:AraC family transcriptional regulator [Phototrophicus methaneseepsis]QPC85012.1 AraC family transcriptional regulator [Phototrophicus methaneseepsis]